MDQPPGRPYRSKKNQPCDNCRRRRVGCFQEDGQESCSLCRFRGTSCTFFSRPAAKKVGSPGLARTNQELILNPISSIHALPQNLDVDNVVEGSTVIQNRTCLLAGLSSDQDPHLLRHLAFDNSNCFGDANWMVWRMQPRAQHPVYFTIFPNAHLDAHPDIYNTTYLDSVVSPYQNILLDLYWRFVHPTLPVLESRYHFTRAIARNKIPASLLGAMYAVALSFLTDADLLPGHKRPEQYTLHCYLIPVLNLEAHTPCLRTVQAALLYMQIPPIIVREPNHPAAWSRASFFLAMAQDIGLHLDPSQWNIEIQEQKTRRILWWAIYMQDKWLAHWLGRPSHIGENDWDVAPLTVDDFSDERGVVSDDFLASAQAFVALIDLTLVLTDVLASFYAVRTASGIDNASVNERRIMAKLESWKVQHNFTILPQANIPNAYFLIFACCTLDLSVRRALVRTEHELSERSRHQAMLVFEQLLEVLEKIQHETVDGLWLSYCKGSLTIIGNIMITFLLSTADDILFEQRKGRLQEYRSLLAKVSERFEFSRLPCQRLNLILESLFGQMEEWPSEVLEEW